MIEIAAESVPPSWPSFEEMLARFQPATPWNETANFGGFFDAAVEASDLDNGPALLAEPQALSFNSSLTVQSVGEGSSEDGAIFHGFLYRGRGFETFIWIEDDLTRARLAWRGSENEFLRAELLLRMFEGRTLTHLR